MIFQLTLPLAIPVIAFMYSSKYTEHWTKLFQTWRWTPLHYLIATLFVQIQQICNRSSFARFSGLRVDPDFVEIPAQLLENWCYETSCLKLISGFHQFAEMETLHLHAIQQLQLELANARERSGTYHEDSQMSQMNSEKNVTQFGQENGNQFDLNGSNASGGNNGLIPNESSDNIPPFASSGNALVQTDHVAGVAMAPSSLLVPPSYLPPGQVTALHPFVMHQQGVPNSVASQVPQSHVSHFHPLAALSPMQQWKNQQAVSGGSQVSMQDDPSASQTDQSMMRSDAKFNYEMPINGQALHGDYLDAHIHQNEETQSVISSSTAETQVLQSFDKANMLLPNKTIAYDKFRHSSPMP
ncbi:hypothetical protein HN51_055326 [Arachis hypogaea]